MLEGTGCGAEQSMGPPLLDTGWLALPDALPRIWPSLSSSRIFFTKFDNFTNSSMNRHMNIVFLDVFL